MKTVLALQFGTLLLLSTTCMAATIEYQHPDLTIVAKEEPLNTVLKSLGKEMRIYVTTPTGLNPVVNCDIQHKPIKQALKTLLSNVSYSLQWQEHTGRLLGLTILAGGDATADTTATDGVFPDAGPQQSAPATGLGGGGGLEAGLAAEQNVIAVAANTAETKAALPDEEAVLAHERERQEERLEEDTERHDAETGAYLQSQGILLLP